MSGRRPLDVSCGSGAGGPSGLGAQLVVLGSDLAQLFERFCRRFEVSLMQARVLNLVASRDPSPLEPWQIGQVLDVGSNHLVAILDRLVEAGLVERDPHPTDARRRLVRMTDAGVDTSIRIRAGLVQLEEGVFDRALSGDEREQLAALTGRLRAALRESVIPVRVPRPGP